MGNIHTVGPNEALIVSGGCCRPTSKKMVVGGWAWSWFLLTDVQRLKLEMMTLTPRCENVETSQGVPLTVTAIAQCKIATEKDYLTIASEQFLGKDADHIKSVILTTLEGHLRAILGTLTVEEVYRDRDQFASLVREVATPDVSHMGIEVLSFTIKDIFDEVDYLSSLGKARTAAVKRDANSGVAQSERDAGIREAECEKAAMDVKYTSDTKIEDSRRTLNVQKALFDTDINGKKEESKLAYELQSAKMQQRITNEEMEIVMVEKKKQTAIEEKEVLRKEKENTYLIKLPSDAESYRLEQTAEANRAQMLAATSSELKRIRLIGAAEGIAQDLIGKAEAEQMKNQAIAYKQYSDAAILSLTLDAFPKIAAEVVAPLSKTDEIVILSGTPAPISSLMATIPPTVHAVTGSDISKVFSKLVRSAGSNSSLNKS